MTLHNDNSVSRASHRRFIREADTLVFRCSRLRSRSAVSNGPKTGRGGLSPALRTGWTKVRVRPESGKSASEAGSIDLSGARNKVKFSKFGKFLRGELL